MLQKLAPFLFFLFFMFPRYASAQVSLFGGPQLTSAKYTVRDKKQPTGSKTGFSFGGGIRIPFENRLYFFPSVYYSRKGYTVTITDSSYLPSPFAVNNNTSIHAIEVAPLFEIVFNNRPSHFFVRFGPAVDFIFRGTERFDTVNTAGARGGVERNMVFSFGDYGRITAQGILHFGYQAAGGFSVFAHYAHGIGSMNNADTGPRILHRIAGISVGYKFQRDPNILDTRNKE